jgi:Protein of unknown function (DUF3800)
MAEFFAPFYPKDAKHRFIAMFRGYFDDSGTHAASRIVVVGGIVATDTQYDLFKETWDSILKRKNLPFFHTTRFKAGKEPPYLTMSAAEKEVLLDQLVRLMSVRIAMSFCCAVPVADYNAALSEEEKKRYGSPYAWAAQMCWTIIRLWAERHDYNDPIPFIVEGGTEGEEHLSAVFNKMVADPVMKRLYRLHSMVLGDKTKFPGLQAADIIANSTHDLATYDVTGGRAPSKWMDIVSHHMNKNAHHQLLVNGELLRSETDDLNEYYREAIASPS